MSSTNGGSRPALTRARAALRARGVGRALARVLVDAAPRAALRRGVPRTPLAAGAAVR